MAEYPDFVKTCGLGSVTGIGGPNCRHRFSPFIEGVMERTYTDEQLEAMKGENNKITFEGREYDGYQATQKQRQIERTMRKLHREKTAYEAARLTEDARAVNIRRRRLSRKYTEFSAAAGLPEQRERTRAGYSYELTDLKPFAALKEYADDWQLMGAFSATEYDIDAGKPTIVGAVSHFFENLKAKPDRAGLTLDAAQSIIDDSVLTLYQANRGTLKFIADSGYVVLNMKKEVATAVPENLRNKYKKYLGVTEDGKKP